MKRRKKTYFKRKRPSQYKKPGPKRFFSSTQLDIVEDIVGALGGRAKELAVYFGVNETTIEYWIKNYPKFQEAWKRGKLKKTLQTAKSLHDMANGYWAPAIHFHDKKVKEYDESGNTIKEYNEVEQIPYMKYHPKQYQAAARQLSILSRDIWADPNTVHHQHEHSGEINFRNIEEIDVSELSDRAQEMLFEVGMKQIGDGTTEN